MPRLWIALGALFGLLAVAGSAWAAHGAPQMLDARALAMLQSALTMAGWHALALLATGVWVARRGGRLPHVAAAAFVLGTLLFCGGVAAAIAGVAAGPIAPVGGTLLILGWALLLLAAVRRA